MAQNLLQENYPDSWTAAVEMLAILHDSDPDLTYREVNQPFVECATFADDIKYHGGGWQGDFHFYDITWVSEGSEDDYDIDDDGGKNLVVAITDSIAWLSGKQGTDYQSGYYYDYIQNRLYPGDEGDAKSYALRLLIHYMGDIVQPFHNEEQYNAEWPEGDMGANKFPLKYHYDVDELHALWDMVLYTQHHNLKRVSIFEFNLASVTDHLCLYSHSLTMTICISSR